MTSLLAAGSSININLGNSLSKPSTSVLVIIALTLLAIAPSLLILLTGFTRIVIVFGLTRQALGLQTTPPNQVIAGLALIFSLFIMAPTLNQMNHDALQPYLHGQDTISQAYDAAQKPLKTWMLKQTGNEELALTTAVDKEHPATPQATPPRRHHPRLLAVGAEERVHHRLRHLHPLPDHRPGRRLHPHVDGCGDAAPDPGVASLQAPSLRDGERLGARHPLAGGQLPVNEGNLMNIASGAMVMTAKLALPILLTSLVIGLVVSLFQSVTQIQEVTLTFVPKLVGIALVFMIAGHWMLGQFTDYVQQLFSQATTPARQLSGVGTSCT